LPITAGAGSAFILSPYMYVKTAVQRKTILMHENKEENDITPRRRRSQY